METREKFIDEDGKPLEDEQIKLIAEGTPREATNDSLASPVNFIFL
jgi:hypothetical protein